MQNNVFVLLCIPKNRRTFAIANKIKNFSLYINLKGKDYDKDCKTADRAYR
jgi:hypothetical protein